MMILRVESQVFDQAFDGKGNGIAFQQQVSAVSTECDRCLSGTTRYIAVVSLV